VARSNIAIAMRFLEEKGLYVNDQLLGGNYYRVITVNSKTGEVHVKERKCRAVAI
jgi:chemotaxis receptor (MCP) glutamine deamidase CheD